MKRYALLAALLLGACRLGEETGAGAPPTTPATPRPVNSEPMVRIGMKVDTAAVTLVSASAATLVDRAGNTIAQPAASEVWTFRVAEDGAIVGAGGGTSVSSSATPLTFRPSGDGMLTIGEKPYRGTVLLQNAGPGRLTAINVLAMEKYLLGVVPFEIGRLKAPDIEALKTQAIAARTYAIGNMNGRGSLGFDFYPTVADQVYGGSAAEDSVISRAVEETRGEIITHAGRPILAYYSSTCGGHTADVDESWPWRPPQPYLRGQPDINEETGEAFCKTSNRFRWTASWQGDSLRAILQQTLRLRTNNPVLAIARIEDVKLDGKSESGRARAVTITADGVAYRVPADSIRWVLRPTPNGSLNSSLIFELKATRAGGEVTALEVKGGGWGHAIGMCQVGAIGRARASQNYHQIIAAYYRDTRIEKLY